tara:strand:+ start:1634 stop:1894 length:261 start_codon:yes stop_codon:yes gene_type:complete
MDALGTILPTRKSIAIGEKMHIEDQAARARIAIDSGLENLDRHEMPEGVRYYASDDLYAIVGRNMRVLWFEVRADGDYSVKVKVKA